MPLKVLLDVLGEIFKFQWTFLKKFKKRLENKTLKNVKNVARLKKRILHLWLIYTVMPIPERRGERWLQSRNTQRNVIPCQFSTCPLCSLPPNEFELAPLTHYRILHNNRPNTNFQFLVLLLFLFHLSNERCKCMVCCKMWDLVMRCFVLEQLTKTFLQQSSCLFIMHHFEDFCLWHSVLLFRQIL